jgi:hypothetical protein
MRTLIAIEANYGFARLVDLAHAELVTVSKHGRSVVVALMTEEDARLKALDTLKSRLTKEIEK